MMADNAVVNVGGTLEVVVSDAQHHGEGRGKYTTYLVEVKGPSNNSASRRRYSDFQWVYQRLLVERAGAIVPIIPHKQALTAKVRFSEELVSDRQATLQKFLQRIMHHPELVDAPSLHTFLTADFTVWENAKKQHPDMEALNEDSEGGEESKKEGTGNRIVGWMGRMTNNARLALGAVDLESTPDDDIFNDLQAYAQNLDQNVKILAKDVTVLVASMKTQSERMEKMGAAFSEMGEYKLDNEVVIRTSSNTMFTKLGQNWNNLSKLTNFAHMSGQTKLDEPIQDLNRDVLALLKAIARRKEVLFNYSRKAHQGKVKMGQLDKIRENGTAGANPEKVQNLEGEVRALKEEGAAMWKEVDTVSKRLQRDVERFKINFHQGFRKTMETFHKVQMEYAEKYVQGWGDILPVLAPLNSNGMPSAPPPSAPDEAVTTLL